MLRKKDTDESGDWIKVEFDNPKTILEVFAKRSAVKAKIRRQIWEIITRMQTAQDQISVYRKKAQTVELSPEKAEDLNKKISGWAEMTTDFTTIDKFILDAVGDWKYYDTDEDQTMDINRLPVNEEILASIEESHRLQIALRLVNHYMMVDERGKESSGNLLEDSPIQMVS